MTVLYHIKDLNPAAIVILPSQLDCTIGLPLDGATFDTWLTAKRASSNFDLHQATIATELRDMQLSFSSSKSRGEDTQR